MLGDAGLHVDDRHAVGDHVVELASNVQSLLAAATSTGSGARRRSRISANADGTAQDVDGVQRGAGVAGVGRFDDQRHDGDGRGERQIDDERVGR